MECFCKIHLSENFRLSKVTVWLLFLKMKKWSSQWTQFMQLHKEAWKKNSGLQQGLNSWPRDTGAMLYQLSYEATDVGSRSVVGSYVPVKELSVNDKWNKSYIWTKEMKWKWRNDRRSERNLFHISLTLLFLLISVSGVLLVCAHSGHNLVPMDKHGLSDPYCVIYENSRQVKIGKHSPL